MAMKKKLDIAKIRKACMERRVKFEQGNKTARSISLSPEKTDFAVTDACICQCWGPHKGNDGGFEIQWQTKGAGFGHLAFIQKKDSKGVHLVIDNECMSRRFVMDVLRELVDRAELKDPPPTKKEKA